MATFHTIAKIEIRIEDAEDRLISDFCKKFDSEAQTMARGTRRAAYLFDVDDAEMAVAWLKEHGAEHDR